MGIVYLKKCIEYLRVIANEFDKFVLKFEA